MFKKLLIKLGIVKPSSTTEIKKNLRKTTKTIQQQKVAEQFYEDMEIGLFDDDF